MASLTKAVVRVAVIGGLTVGAGVLIAGPERMQALGQQVRSKMVHAIDSRIDDPVAMRQQLRDLEGKYPQRIADARSMLAELNEQIRQVERDKAVSERVVALAQADLDEMKDLLARAEEVRSANDGRQVVRVAFNDRTMDVPEAYAQANRIADTVASYGARVAECGRELAHLERDARQTESLLSRLNSEYADFQTQLANLDRQIDTVARKERMVKLMAERQKRIDELGRYKAESLDQFKSSLSSRVAELDARLETLAGREDRDSYEDRARIEVETETSIRIRLEQHETVTPTPKAETVVGGKGAAGAAVAIR